MFEALEARCLKAVYQFGDFGLYTDQPWAFTHMHDQNIALVHVGPFVLVEFKNLNPVIVAPPAPKLGE